MQIVYKKISDLKKYEKNNKKHPEKQLEKIVASIKEYGFKNPVLVDKNNVIIAGHGRTLAAERLGMEEVPCIDCSDLNAKQVKALRLMDNKSAELAEWDFDNIKAELEELKLEEFDIDLTGFDMSDFEEEKEVKEDEFDVEEQLKKPVMSKLGDIWLLGRHRLMCGDSTDKATVEKLMDGKKADMAFTDPPYNVAYTGGLQFKDGKVEKNNREMIKNDDIDIYPEVFQRLCDFVSGACYVWFADTKATNLYAAAEKLGDIHALIIWVKNGGYGALNANYKQKHEPCLYWKPKGKKLDFVGATTETTIWEINKDGINKLHPTQKPVALAIKAIKNHSAGLVLDLFGGSGSTLIACQQLNRINYSMELDEKYVDVIVNRFKEFVGETKDIKCIRNGETFTYEEIFRETI